MSEHLRDEPHGRPHVYHLVIDNRPHEWPTEFINGKEIKELARVDVSTYSVWEIVPGPGDDIEIADHEKVDLKGCEKRFITGKKHTTEGIDGLSPHT